MSATCSPPLEGADVRFVMDFSLCRVSRTLRLLGFDVVCRPEVRGEGIIHVARHENRVIVTGSRKMIPHLVKMRREDLSQRIMTTERERTVVAYDSDGASVYDSESEDEVDSPLSFVVVNSSAPHAESLVKVLQDLRLPWDESRLFTRCVECNLLIVPIRREDVNGRTPDAVLCLYSNFYECPGCRKVYWGVDNGVVVNYKALRTIEHLRKFRSAAEASQQHVTCASIRRHFSALPRTVKQHIFAFLDSASVLAVAAAVPAVKQLAEAAARNEVFVPIKQSRRRHRERMREMDAH